MRKLAIAAAMLLGTVALGMGQNVKPSLSVIAIYPHAITLELNAGSYAAPDGFQVRWEWQGSGDRVVQFFGACPQYALQPYQTVQVTIDGVSSDECSTTYNPLPLNCNFPYRFQARTFPYAAESTKVTTLTAPCQ